MPRRTREEFESDKIDETVMGLDYDPNDTRTDERIRNRKLLEKISPEETEEVYTSFKEDRLPETDDDRIHREFLEALDEEKVDANLMKQLEKRRRYPGMGGKKHLKSKKRRNKKSHSRKSRSRKHRTRKSRTHRRR